MLQRFALGCVIAALTSGFAAAQSPSHVQTLAQAGAIKTEGTWSLGVRAGDFVFIAGMPGVDPASNRMVEDPQAQIRQALLNIQSVARSEGATLQDCVRLVVYLGDLNRFAPLVDKVQAELWGKPPYPPRTMIEVQRLFDGMIVEIESTFYVPARK
jgi:enamine deaminase RidA (YjgF/YER057c/UK114 family)